MVLECKLARLAYSYYLAKKANPYEHEFFSSHERIPLRPRHPCHRGQRQREANDDACCL